MGWEGEWGMLNGLLGFLWGTEKVLALESGDGLHNIMKILNTTELTLSKWLKMVNFQ